MNSGVEIASSNTLEAPPTAREGSILFYESERDVHLLLTMTGLKQQQQQLGITCASFVPMSLTPRLAALPQ